MPSTGRFQLRLVARLSATSLFASTLLAACGHADTPAAGENATIAIAPASSPVIPDDIGEKQHELSTPPPGTLHYTIALTGELHSTGKHKGEFHDATIKRKVEVTSRMQAHLANGTLADVSPARPKGKPGAEAASAPIEALAKEMAKCNGDMACIMQKNAQRMTNPQKEQAIRDAGKQILGTIGRVAVWSRQAPCEGRVVADDDDDRATWWEDVGEGYRKTGFDKRHRVIHANDRFDCMPVSPTGSAAAAIEAMAQGTLIYVDTQTGDYDITFGASAIDATPTVNGKPGQPVQVGAPEIALTGFDGAAPGEPFGGSQSVDVKSEDGLPLHAEITWTFTPDKT